MLRKFFEFIIDSIQTIVFTLALFVLGYLFIAQPNKIRGSSMVPNFEDGELLLTEKVSYKFVKPKRGDVVIFRAPPSEACSEDECEYIKRVIGLPGEEIRIENNHIFISGKELEEVYLQSNVLTEDGSFLKEGRAFLIPPGNYILLGDNRSHSRDSREFGPIEIHNIIGKAFIRYWPPKTFGLIQTPKYNL